MSGAILEIPGDLLKALPGPPEERADRLRREIIVRLYQKGFLSFGKAQELAGMTRGEFHVLLGEEGFVRRIPHAERPPTRQGDA